MKTQQAYIGKTVHYVSENGEHNAAIITRTWTDEFDKLQSVNLFVIEDYCEDVYLRYAEGSRTINSIETKTKQEVEYDESGLIQNTWHFIETEEEE